MPHLGKHWPRAQYRALRRKRQRYRAEPVPAGRAGHSPRPKRFLRTYGFVPPIGYGIKIRDGANAPSRRTTTTTVFSWRLAPAPDGAFAPSETFSPDRRLVPPVGDGTNVRDGANAPSRRERRGLDDGHHSAPDGAFAPSETSSPDRRFVPPVGGGINIRYGANAPSRRADSECPVPPRSSVRKQRRGLADGHRCVLPILQAQSHPLRLK